MKCCDPGLVASPPHILKSTQTLEGADRPYEQCGIRCAERFKVFPPVSAVIAEYQNGRNTLGCGYDKQKPPGLECTKNKPI